MGAHADHKSILKEVLSLKHFIVDLKGTMDTQPPTKMTESTLQLLEVAQRFEHSTTASITSGSVYGNPLSGQKIDRIRDWIPPRDEDLDEILSKSRILAGGDAATLIGVDWDEPQGSCYEALSIHPGSTPNQIEEAFQNLVVSERSIGVVDTERRKRINQAYIVLSNDKRRRAYDAEIWGKTPNLKSDTTSKIHDWSNENADGNKNKTTKTARHRSTTTEISSSQEQTVARGGFLKNVVAGAVSYENNTASQASASSTVLTNTEHSRKPHTYPPPGTWADDAPWIDVVIDELIEPWFDWFDKYGKKAEGAQVNLTQDTINRLCSESREILMKQPMLLELVAPLTVTHEYEMQLVLMTNHACTDCWRCSRRILQPS